MFILEQLPNIEDYKVITSKKRKFEYDYLLIKSKIYKISYDQIKDNLLQIKGNNEIIKNINPVNFNINDIINNINISIIKSRYSEINKEILINQIKRYLIDYFVFDNMVVKMNDYELKIFLPNDSFDKYYLIDNNTKFLINDGKYKLYKNIIDITNKEINYIIIRIDYISGVFKRNFLDDVYIINYNDIYLELNKIKNKVYLNKEFTIYSNNCYFKLKIEYMKLALSDEKKKISNNSIFNLESIDFDLVTFQFKFNNSKIGINKQDTNFSNIGLQIINGPKPNTVYDIEKVKEEIINILNFNYIKINDTFNILVNNDLLKLEISLIGYDTNSSYFYYFNKINKIKIFENIVNKIYAYDLSKVYEIKKLDVELLSFNNPILTFNSLFNSENQEKKINISVLKKYISDIHFFKDKNHFGSEYTLLFKNIETETKEIVLDKTEEDINTNLYKITYNTEINITKGEECEYKLIDDSDKSGTSINLDKEKIKNIINNFEILGLSGMNDQINKIVNEMILPRSELYPESFKKFVKIPKGILLYGPPGTGKTSLAKHLGKLIGISKNFIKLMNGTEIFSKYVGESEKNIRDLFSEARKNKNHLHLLIIDEVDSIFKIRNTCDSTKSDVVNQFLGEMDGLKAINNLIIIGITNKIDTLDKAILRPGRFSSKIYCGLPNKESRLNIIKLYHNKIKDSINFEDIDFDSIVKKTDNFSGAQIEHIYTKIIELVIENKFNDKEIIITNEIIYDIISKILKI